MATLEVEDQVSSLLDRKVVEDRIRGAMSPQFEAQSVFEGIASILLANPRSVLLLFLFAKNGLQKATLDCIDAIDALYSSIEDTANISYAIRDLEHLKSARNAVLQLTTMDSVNQSNNSFVRVGTAITKFLTSQVSKSVRVAGASELKRPATEAQLAIPKELATVKSLYDEVLTRLSDILVGVDNFVASPLSTSIGASVAIRAKADIDSLITELEASPDSVSPADVAVRLLTSQAALTAMSSTPDPFASVLAQDVPAGYFVSARSPNVAVTVESSAAPFVMVTGATMTVTDGTTSLGPFNFPHDAFDLENQACILGEEVVFPVTIPANYYLFIDVSGVVIPFGPLTSGSRSKAQILTDLNALFLAASTDLEAEEFADAGSDRILVRSPTEASLTIVTAYSDGVSYYTDSAHSLLGFSATATGSSGTTDAQLLVDAFNFFFSTLATASIQEDKILVTGVGTSPGATLDITTNSLSLNGSFAAESTQLTLYGTVFGEEIDPIDPRGLLDVGDTITVGSQTGVVSSMSGTSLLLATAISTVEDEITVESSLQQPYESLNTALEGFYRDLSRTRYNENLAYLDQVITPIKFNSSPSQRAAALAVLTTIRGYLEDLQTILENSLHQIPTGGATREFEAVNSIVETLTERKFDRALDLLLRCDVLELVQLTNETASYAGNLSKLMSDVAKNDVSFPNRSLDEELEGQVTDTGEEGMP